LTTSEPSLALQSAILARLRSSAALTALIPADNIMDSNGRPERIPGVNIGEGQTVFRRFDSTTYADIHVWFIEPGLASAKTAASAIVDALLVDAQITGVLNLDSFTCHDLRVTQTRYLRDPHGGYSHAVVSVAGIMKAS
jgi:hypothetical protein